MVFCNNYMCDLWDSDRNGGHCMLVKCQYTSELIKKEKVSEEEKEEKKGGK